MTSLQEADTLGIKPPCVIPFATRRSPAACCFMPLPGAAISPHLRGPGNERPNANRPPDIAGGLRSPRTFFLRQSIPVLRGAARGSADVLLGAVRALVR